MPGFTHLHVHSEYSLLDGLARVGDLVKTASELGFDALALTDHGVMFGALQFYQYAKKAGIKPIIGSELYVAPRTRHDRESGRDSRSHHLTVLAADETGYRNLTSLVSLAQTEGFYYKPRVDRELLERYAEGLIVLSGCPSSELSRQLLDQDEQAARATLGWFRDVFAGRYFVELQEHDLDFLPGLNRALVALAREFDLPLVATNDVHYSRATDVRAHEVLLCVQTGTTMTNPNRMRLGSDTFFLRSEEEMRALFSELPEALSNTTRIAEMCDVRFDFGTTKLPAFAVPEGDTPETYLRGLCERGVRERFGEPSAEVRARLEMELSVIHQMGFDAYFLIVWDLCSFALREGIWWNVRGSGAGSLVSYCLHITNLDPLAHNLIFERFLNPSRVSMPDIDLDFPDDQREDIIRYAGAKYGRDHVAQIITFGTMGARASVRDAGRALDMPLSLVDQVARLIPAISGKPCKIEDVLRPSTADEPNEFFSGELVSLAAEQDDVASLLSAAQSLEGVARHASTHAAGVVISDRPLVEHLPLHRPTGAADALPLTQYAMKDVEKLGLLKVDLLGLSTLTVLRRAVELVKEYHGVEYRLDTIPLNDPETYELLSSGNLTGLFQVEGAGMRRTLVEMRPSRFEHIVAAIALYRPGPMEYIGTYIKRMHGLERVTYRHARLEPILEETYGILVYQEQIIQVARDLAGYDAGEADTIRKAVGKKVKDELMAHHDKFVAGAVANGIPAATGEKIWQDIETFARYGFNKAHAADYAVIVCQTAFLKAHYPVEYMTALLAVERDNTDKIGQVTADCHRLGIRLLRPSVNHSGQNFRIEPLEERHFRPGITRKRGIRFGLSAIKNVGEGGVEAILAGRAGEPFRDLQDFCQRADLRLVGKRALESLIRVGALGDFGSRAGLLSMLDSLVGESARHHEAIESGQMSFFGAGQPAGDLLGPVPAPKPDRAAELAWEKELIGLYLSEHPLHRLAEAISDQVTVLIGDLDEGLVGQSVTIAGITEEVRRITTKKGATMVFARLVDLQGAVDLTVFPRTLESTREHWHDDRVLVVRGRVEQREDRIQVVVEDVWAFVEEPEAPGSPAPESGEGAPALAAAPESEPETAPSAAVERAVAQSTTAQTTPAQTAGYQLTVTLPRASSMEDDIALLKRVYATLMEYPGDDRFALRVENGNGLVELDFPNSSTRYCVSLTQRLEELVGTGRLRAESR